MKIQIINQSLLEANTKYIAHQCNCITQHSAGIAKAIFDKFPYANTYQYRPWPSILGNIDVCGTEYNRITLYNYPSGNIYSSGVDKNEYRYVINMYVQYYPGGPKLFDNYELRLKNLQKCLDKVANIENLESIGFPEGMGCRLAKGFWPDYLNILEKFADKIYVEQKAKTYLYNYRK